MYSVPLYPCLLIITTWKKGNIIWNEGV